MDFEIDERLEHELSKSILIIVGAIFAIIIGIIVAISLSGIFGAVLIIGGIGSVLWFLIRNFTVPGLAAYKASKMLRDNMRNRTGLNINLN